MTETEKRTPSVSEYREAMRILGKKEFILSKMIEYGFWPKDLPTPHQKQQNETEEQFKKRTRKREKYESIIRRIAELYQEKGKIDRILANLRKEYDESWSIDKIRKDIAKRLWEESKKRRAERKEQREEEKRLRSEAWKKKKAESIVFVGKGYSSFLYHLETDVEKLNKLGLPELKTDHELADFLELEYKRLRFLVYHRDATETDHYVRYTIPKRRGGERLIAAPKKDLKRAQRKILDGILYKINTSSNAHGFQKERSVITNAKQHSFHPQLIITMDLENFFPTITFERVRGMFHGFGYSGQVSTLLAMLCTYCERIPIEVRDNTKFVATSRRILPQGSPASPMISNIITKRLDARLSKLAEANGFRYSRYADDMSFSLEKTREINLGKFLGVVTLIIKEEGFDVNRAKTRFLRKNNQQAITGIVMNNSSLAIPRRWMRKFRAAIHNARVFKEVEGKLPPEIKNELIGMKSWATCVNHARYEKYIRGVNELLN